MSEQTSLKTYKCPRDGGDMKHFVSNAIYTSYVCEICQATFIARTEAETSCIKIGGQDVIIDNIETANILKKEF
jgi:hypothetical protein